MAVRYIGELVVYIQYHDNNYYFGTISTAGSWGVHWKFSDLHAPACGFRSGIAYDSPEAYDEMAASAVGFGSYYTTSNRPREGRGDEADVLAGFPDAAGADAIEEGSISAMDEAGKGQYYVRRSPTGKGRWCY